MTGLDNARARLAAGDAAGALSALQQHLRKAPSDEILVLAARAWRQLGQHAEAATTLEGVSARHPGNGILAHNLAAARGDAGDHVGAADAARQAIRLRDAPESWLVLGRALQGAGDVSGAREALAGAIARRPGYTDALKGLSQLIWMTSRDPEAALAPLRTALAATPSPELAALLCGVIKDIVGPEAAYAFGRQWAGRGYVGVELAAAAAAASINAAWQHQHAQAAARLAPDLAEARHACVTALLAQGMIEPALADLEAWLARSPDDQIALALQRTAWRMGERPEALDAADYARVARAYEVETPVGWPDRAAWLTALTAALHKLHSFQAEPFGQSVRAGAQSRTDPRWAGDPVIDATFEAFKAPLAAYVNDIDPRDPTFRSGIRDAVIAGAWSVRLGSGGRHSDHVHPRGWVSSAFYVTVPEPTPSEPHGGWLRFGATHLGVGADLPAEYRIEPKPGRLALFPSWLWHGTEPFSGAGERLTIAFDVQPAGAS